MTANWDVDVAALHPRAGILQFWVIWRTVLPPADRNTDWFTQEIDRAVGFGVVRVHCDVHGVTHPDSRNTQAILGEIIVTYRANVWRLAGQGGQWSRRPIHMGQASVPLIAAR